MKCFLYRGMRHVAGKGLQRTWEVKVIVTGACVGISYYGKKTNLVYYTFTFCLPFGCVAWMSLLLSAVSHAGSLSGSRADLLSVASWQTSDKDGGEISHVCHRSDGVISSNLAQSDVAEKIYQLGFVYMCFLHFFSRGLLFILRASVGLSVVVPKPFCSWKIQTHATWGTRPSIFDRRKNIQTHRNFQS